MNVPEDRDNQLSRYREGPTLLENIVKELQDTSLDFKPSGGGWSIRQIVHHIVDGDYIWTFAIKMAFGNQQPEFFLKWYSSMTQDTWADHWAYSRRSIDTSLSLLKTTREHVLQLLASVPEAWNRIVVLHTPKGEIEQVPAGFIIKMQADHIQHHVERIRSIKQECSNT
jgi:uncharacterized damage-inducible protein DinB